jgi:phage gpG-like protein
MAEVFTSYNVDNDKAFQDALNKYANLGADLKPAFGEIARDFFRSQLATFSNKPGLFPDYKQTTSSMTMIRETDSPYKRRKKKDPKSLARPYPMLVRTGKLRDSMVEKYGAPNQDTILNISSLSLAIGTKVEYGIYHQSDANRKKIPLRKFLFIGPEAPRFASSGQKGRLERWLKILDAWTRTNASKSGFKS